MLPIASAASGRLSGCAVAVATVAIADVVPVAAVDVVPVAAVEVVIVVVDIDVVIATPSATVAPAAAPGRSHGYTYTKRDRHAGSVIAYGRIVDRGVRIDGWSIHYGWVITWHVNHLGICLLDYDYLLALDNLGFNLLLL